MCDLYDQYELFTSEIIYVCQIKGEYLLCLIMECKQIKDRQTDINVDYKSKKSKPFSTFAL